MIKPDKPAAIDKLKHLHDALNGVLMCARGGTMAHNLAVCLRGELRQVLRFLGEPDDGL